MPDPVRTLSAPGLVRVGALEIAISKIGERETAKNEGPIVDWALQGITSRPAAGPGARREGWAQWCAFFVSQCFRRELIRRGDGVLLKEWQRLASGSCDSLWAHLSAQGWTWRAGAEGARPDAGDIAFFGPEGDLAHVGLVEMLDGAGRLHTVEGNAGDRVAALQHPADHPRIFGFARVPW